MVRRSVPEQSYQYEYDADGNLLWMWLAADMNCDGLVDFGDINAFVDAVVDPVAWHLAYPNCNILNGDLNGDGTTDFGDINDFTALVQTGNSGASRTYAWDGENRLVAVEPTAGTRIPDGAHRVAFKYDYLGRRVQKHVETWVEDPNDPNNSAWTDGQTWKYVWSGWRMLLELGAAPTEDNVISAYTWGLDLAGQASGGSALPQGLEGAGTIGGLLAASWPASALPGRAVDLNVAYFYDGNGNVTQVVDWSQDPNDPNTALVARYEYDPFGNVVSYAGQYAETNKFRFSTKTWDDETGLGYWGYRYYNPTLGRWVSRDPIEERGSMLLRFEAGASAVGGATSVDANPYTYVQNRASLSVDPLGLNLYAVEGTMWGAGDLGNTELMYLGATKEPKRYYHDGPDLLGLESMDIAQDVYTEICDDIRAAHEACSEYPEINLVGWSRGAAILTWVAHEINNNGCCLCRNFWGCTSAVKVEVNWLGLFDAVDQAGDIPDSLMTAPPRVRRISHAAKTSTDGDQTYLFPTAPILPMTYFWRYDGSPTTHGDIGANRKNNRSFWWMVTEAKAAGVGI